MSDRLASEWQTAPSGRRRKYYRITPKGSAVLAEKAAEWRAFSMAVNGILFATAEA